MPSCCVLLVDDDPAIRLVVVATLEGEGHAVRAAAGGAAALELLRRERVDLVLLDMRMPGMDGWAFADAYRGLPPPRAPLAVFTAAVDPARHAEEVGADAFLAKPYELDDLLALVGRLCGAPAGR